jgi:hypothetical protein
MSDLGTCQGAVFSSLLFSFVVNPLATLLKSKGFGVKIGGIQIACLLYTNDLVLIADSEEQLQEMMNTTTGSLQQWRFIVSARITQVVAFGRGETRSVWRIGNESVHNVRSYKYLGLMFEKGASGTKCKIRTSIKPKQNTNAYVRLDLVIPVFKSVILHFSGICSPKMLYGAEAWSCNSETTLLDLENFQIQGARKVFGKRAMSTVIFEAA